MIYLDHNATTPILPEVLEAMMPYLTSEWGNPSSSYKFGSKLKTVIETARAQVAELIGAHQTEIIFTSCATESNNAAIHAALKAAPSKRHIVTSAVEHSFVELLRVSGKGRMLGVESSHGETGLNLS
jgi:cysteine desulfurase